MSGYVQPGTPTVTVTFFANAAATSKREERLSLAALAELIRTTNADTKQSLPWLKLARFGDDAGDPPAGDADPGHFHVLGDAHAGLARPARERLRGRQLRALRRIGDRLPLRPLRGVDAPAQIDERLFRKIDWEGADCVRFGCHL